MPPPGGTWDDHWAMNAFVSAIQKNRHIRSCWDALEPHALDSHGTALKRDTETIPPPPQSPHDRMQKALRETQTLRAGCSKAEPKISAPPQTPFPGARDGQNLISWRRSLPLPTNPVWWISMHPISSYGGNRPTHKQTNRTDYNTLRRS